MRSTISRAHFTDISWADFTVVSNEWGLIMQFQPIHFQKLRLAIKYFFSSNGSHFGDLHMRGETRGVKRDQNTALWKTRWLNCP